MCLISPRSTFLLSVALLGIVSCSSVPDGDNGDRGDKADEVTGTDGRVTLQIGATWSTGEYGDEPLPLDTDISYDEDEYEYSTSAVVSFGPIAECAKASGDRSEDAVCSWHGPSEQWQMQVTLDHAGILTVSVYTGDIDTDGSTSLPITSVPASQPWTFDFSPDNAGGGVGSINFSIQHQAASAAGLGCDGLSYSSVDDIQDDGSFDAYIECWMEDTLCWKDNKESSALMLSDLFYLVWEGNRSLDDLNDEGAEILLYSTGEDVSGELLTVAECE